MPTPAAPATVTASPAAVSLASLYDVVDPEPTYTLPDPIAPKPAAPVASVVTPQTTPPAPSAPAPAAPAPAAAATPAPAAPKHPAHLLAQCESLGIHPLAVDRLDTESLTRVVMDAFSARLAEANTRGLAAAATTPAAPVVPAAPAAPVVPAFDWGEHDDVDASGRVVGKKKYTDNDLDPAIAFHLKKQAAEIEQLKSFIGRMNQSAKSQAENAVESQFDAAFDKLGGVFGKGNAKSLKGSKEFANRSTVFHAVKGMFSALPEELRGDMTIEKAVFTMAKSMYNAEVAAAAAGAPAPAPSANGRAPTAAAFANGHVAVPTQRRQSDKPFGAARAQEELTDWLRQQEVEGGLPPGGDTSLDEFLPG